MSKFKWNRDIELGIESLDRDHKQLIAILNKLNDCAEHNGSEFLSLLEQLGDCAREHFKREEEAMVEFGLAQGAYQAHRAEHKAFESLINRLTIEQKPEPDHQLAMKASIELTEWLLNHIISSDLDLQPLFHYQPNRKGLVQKIWHRLACCLPLNLKFRWVVLAVSASFITCVHGALSGFSTEHWVLLGLLQAGIVTVFFQTSHRLAEFSERMTLAARQERHHQAIEVFSEDEIGDIAKALEHFRRLSIKDKLLIDGFSLSPTKVSKQKMAIFNTVKMINSLKRKADLDALTGAYSRAHFFERFDQHIEEADQGSFPLTVLMLDIDLFKRINDTHGHPAGDQVLASVVRALKSHLREEDSLGRIGGEEFAIILPHVGLERGKEIAERLRLAIESLSVIYAGHQIPVTISIGVFCSQPPHSTPNELLKAADQRLYAAKHAGRNRICTEDKQNLS